MNFDDLITIENVCEACEETNKPCEAPCERWNELLYKSLEE